VLCYRFSFFFFFFVIFFLSLRSKFCVQLGYFFICFCASFFFLLSASFVQLIFISFVCIFFFFSLSFSFFFLLFFVFFGPLFFLWLFLSLYDDEVETRRFRFKTIIYHTWVVNGTAGICY